jgi:hypothetical protein
MDKNMKQYMKNFIRELRSMCLCSLKTGYPFSRLDVDPTSEEIESLRKTRIQKIVTTFPNLNLRENDRID